MNTSADLLKELRIDRKAPPPVPPSRRGLWIALAVVIALLLAAGAWFAFGRTKPLDVRTATVAAIANGNASSSVLDATGYVVARRMATVSAQITGTLTAVLIEEGDHVSKGQVVARLDDAQYEAALDAARTQAGAAHALVAQYRAQLTQDEHDAERQQSLAARALISRQLAEQAATLAATAKAQLASQLKQAAAADAHVAEAQVNFDYCVVRAPFDGVITTKDAQVGEIISPLSAGGGYTRTGVGTIVDMDSLEVDVDVNEAYIGRVQPDMPAEAVLEAYPEWHIPAHVIAIVPTADRGKATVKVRVALHAKDARIVPDMGVRVSFLEATKPDAKQPEGVRVPATALIERSGKTLAIVVGDDGRVHAHAVKTGIAMGNDRQVLAGLAAGDRVVLAPSQTLRDGTEVKPAADAAGD